MSAQEFRLTPQEANSEVWLKVSRYLAERLERARLKNDSVLLPPLDTQAVRGEIKALRDLLALAKELPPVPPGTAGM